MSILKKLRKSRANKEPTQMAEIIATFAADFLEDCTDHWQRQNYLNCACTAWNIALLPAAESTKKVEQMVSNYRSVNPGLTDSEHYRKHLTQLIARKQVLYPEVRRAVVKATIADHQGRNRITVISAPV